MEVLVRNRTIRANVVKPRDACLASEFVNEFGLPKEHHMLLILSCFFNLGRVKIAGLFLLDFENFSEGAAAKFLNDLEATLEDFLVFLEGH